MKIIDAQIHDVMPSTGWSPSFTPEQAIEASAELAIAAMDAVGVAGALVSSNADHCRGYIGRFPERFAGVPWVAFPKVEPEFPVDQFIDGLGATPGMVGIRLILGIPDGSRIEILRAGGFEPYFVAAERNGLAVFITPHGFVPALHETIQAHPGLTFVIDHLGLYTPPFTPPGVDLFGELPAVLELAQFPNVAVKFTGAPSLSSEQYPFDDLWPRLHRIIDAFGVDRLMWGSDFTRCKTLHTYRESVDFLLLTTELSEADKEMLASGSVRRWLGWPKPE